MKGAAEWILHLGDVYRYDSELRYLLTRHEYTGSKDLFEPSIKCYLDTLLYHPECGQACNQLALMYGHVRSLYPGHNLYGTQSIYYHLKSIFVSESFEQAKANLESWVKTLGHLVSSKQAIFSSPWDELISMTILKGYTNVDEHLLSLDIDHSSIPEIIQLFSICHMLKSMAEGVADKNLFGLSSALVYGAARLGWDLVAKLVKGHHLDSDLPSLLLLCVATFQLVSEEYHQKAFSGLSARFAVLEYWSLFVSRDEIPEMSQIGTAIPMHPFICRYYEIAKMLLVSSPKATLEVPNSVLDESLSTLWKIYLKNVLASISREAATVTISNTPILFYHKKRKKFFPFVPPSQIPSKIYRLHRAVVTFDLDFIMDYFHLVKRASDTMHIYIPSIIMDQLNRYKRDRPRDTLERIRFLSNRKYKIVIEAHEPLTNSRETDEIRSVSMVNRRLLQSYLAYMRQCCALPAFYESCFYFASNDDHLLRVSRNFSINGLKPDAFSCMLHNI